MKLVVFKPDGQQTALPRDAILRSTFKVGRFTCTLTVDCGAIASGQPASGMMRAEWKPDLPRKLNARAIAEYRAGRGRRKRSNCQQTCENRSKLSSRRRLPHHGMRQSRRSCVKPNHSRWECRADAS